MHPERDNQTDDRRQTALKAARRAHAEERLHVESQVESAGVDEQPFQNVRVASQIGPTQAARFVQMRIRLCGTRERNGDSIASRPPDRLWRRYG